MTGDEKGQKGCWLPRLLLAHPEPSCPFPPTVPFSLQTLDSAATHLRALHSLLCPLPLLLPLLEWSSIPAHLFLHPRPGCA